MIFRNVTKVLAAFAASIFISAFSGGIASATVPIVNSQITTDSSGNNANDATSAMAMSQDGKYYAFVSKATNLVSGDTNGHQDVFLKDTTTGATTLISVSSSGVQANADSTQTSISYNGRYVPFVTSANLTSNASGSNYKVYVRDTQLGTTTLVSSSSSGVMANSSSTDPVVSADGRYIAFDSSATNLISGVNPGPSASEVYVKDMTNNQLEVISVNSAGTIGNTYNNALGISCDGGVIMFRTQKGNLTTGGTGSYRVMMASLGLGGVSLTDITANENGDSSGGGAHL